MQLRCAFVILAFAAFNNSAAAEPKAYDLVKYRGQAGTLTITFDFADGYEQASEIRVTDTRTKKTTRFKLDDNGNQRFVPAMTMGRRHEEILLKMNLDDASAPEQVEGTYRSVGKNIRFTLTRQ
ncbi:MAG TPA: hypothetical protein VGC85_07685 [Chthoniobacterales bacterium]